MFKNKYPGKFITIEGIDGSGATTQAIKLKEYLEEKNLPFWLTQEPTDGVIGSIIKSHISGTAQITDHLGLQLLFAADRANHLDQEIIPRLQKGEIVISDRYFLSSVAYGSLDIGDEDWLYQINDQFLLPDLTILLKVSAKTGMGRIKENRLSFSMFEQEEKLKKVWNNYEKIHKKYPNIVVIDGEKSETEVFENVKEAIEKIL